MKHADNRLKNIANLLKAAEKNLRKANKLLDTMRDEIADSYDDVPGVLGIFDGTHMTDGEGKKYEVNPNYSAKSLLLPGDSLKMVEGDEGKLLFKQVSKVDRKRVEGILNKKEGKWYALTDAGSYRILDVAVEFRDGQVNDELTVLIPEDNLNSEWGALEKMAKEDVKVEKPAKKEEEKPAKEAVEKKEEPKEEKKPTKKPAPRKKKEEPKEEKKPARKPAPKKAAAKKPAPKPAAPKRDTSTADAVDSLLDDDDLR